MKASLLGSIEFITTSIDEHCMLKETEAPLDFEDIAYL